MTTRSWDKFFTLADFEGVEGAWTPLKNKDSVIAMEIANKILAEALAKAPVVYGYEYNDEVGKIWSDTKDSDPVPDTHSASLVNVKEIKDE